ncbi:hypothetical protein THAOC_22083, partial [Thalassiosira oceanica]
MSCVPAPATAADVCANCGKEGNDAVKLKNCTACLLVKYCGVDCQRIHRKLHKKACKERAAELKDEKLYSQGTERPERDFCPLCLLAIPFPMDQHASMRPCCTKSVCNGCLHASFKIKRDLALACPFCRAPNTEKDGEDGVLGMIRKRVAAKDPEAMSYFANMHFNGMNGLEKDTSRGMDLENSGRRKDKVKGIAYLESAAMQGDVETRHNLGLIELDNGYKYNRALRHFLICAKMGHKKSLDMIKDFFADGLATRAQYMEGLKGYQDASFHVLVSDALALEAARDARPLEQPRAGALVALEEEPEPRESDLADGTPRRAGRGGAAGTGPEPGAGRAAAERADGVDAQAELDAFPEIFLAPTRGAVHDVVISASDLEV